jgi:glycerate kinase
VKIVVAPNAFKGSLTALQAAAAMTAGVARAAPTAEIVQVPVADGGDGMVDIVREALQGELHRVSVSGPRRRPVEAAYCFVPETGLAAIEMALASGLVLLPEEQRDPTVTTTLGTGELIADALSHGVSRIVVGIGGSATNDGGLGMATALGIRFLDQAGQPVEPMGGALGRVRHIDMDGLDPRLGAVRIEAVCDVDNPLTGPKGAAQVYGPQKGATLAQVEQLDAGLVNLADVIQADLGLDVRALPGAGAAGGLGAGLYAFLGAELRRGVDLVLELVGLNRQLEGADLVLTGEGQIDAQTAHGKAPAGVGAAARARDIPCLAITGSMGKGLDALREVGIDAVFSLCTGPLSLEQAMRDGARFMSEVTEQAVRCFLAGGYRHGT